jgi:small GTP-binding protein
VWFMFQFTQNASSFPTTASKNIPTAKISIIGLPAVGKTTLKKLLCGQIISDKYNPTQGFDLGKVSIDGLKFNIWDFGGQKSYIMNQMSQYIAGSDIVLLVTDSTPQNVLTTKELLSYTKDLVEDGCEMVAIANKQDIQGAMEPGRVENVLQVPTFGMVATEGGYRDQMVELIHTLMRKVEQKKSA